MMGPIYVIYHKGCMDGFGAAWAAHRGLSKHGLQAEYLPASYGDAPPDIVPGTRIYVLDFSYSRDVMDDLASKYKVILLDHHATAMRDMEGAPYCHFDMNKSGAHLAWRHFNPDEDLPALIRYIEDRDLWKWQLPESREVSAALASHPHTFDVWDTLEVPELAREGRAILRCQEKIVESIARQAIWTDVAGYSVPVVNTSVLQSEACEALLAQYPDAAFAGAFYQRPASDGGADQKWSVRSRPGFDVSQVAKQFGGGGHPQAAGFNRAAGTPALR